MSSPRPGGRQRGREVARKEVARNLQPAQPVLSAAQQAALCSTLFIPRPTPRPPLPPPRPLRKIPIGPGFGPRPRTETTRNVLARMVSANPGARSVKRPPPAIHPPPPKRTRASVPAAPSLSPTATPGTRLPTATPTALPRAAVMSTLNNAPAAPDGIPSASSCVGTGTRTSTGPLPAAPSTPLPLPAAGLANAASPNGVGAGRAGTPSQPYEPRNDLVPSAVTALYGGAITSGSGLVIDGSGGGGGAGSAIESAASRSTTTSTRTNTLSSYSHASASSPALLSAALRALGAGTNLLASLTAVSSSSSNVMLSPTGSPIVSVELDVLRAVEGYMQHAEGLLGTVRDMHTDVNAANTPVYDAPTPELDPHLESSDEEENGEDGGTAVARDAVLWSAVGSATNHGSLGSATVAATYGVAKKNMSRGHTLGGHKRRFTA